jgi:hypothetical protein
MAETKARTQHNSPNSSVTANFTEKSAPAANGNGTAKKTPVSFDAAFLTSPIVSADDTAIKEAAQPKNKRSDAQLALDGVTPQIHKAWIDAGKPAAFAKIPTVSYPVDPAGVTKLKGMIRKAAEQNETRARFGSEVTVTPEMVTKSPKLTDAHLGLVLVTFGIVDRSKGKAEKPAETAKSPE